MHQLLIISFGGQNSNPNCRSNFYSMCNARSIHLKGVGGKQQSLILCIKTVLILLTFKSFLGCRSLFPDKLIRDYAGRHLFQEVDMLRSIFKLQH